MFELALMCGTDQTLRHSNVFFNAYQKKIRNTLSQKCVNVCVVASAQRVEELEEALKKKDDDMKQMEERYKKYLEKAKSVSLLCECELCFARSSVTCDACCRCRSTGAFM